MCPEYVIRACASASLILHFCGSMDHCSYPFIAIPRRRRRRRRRRATRHCAGVRTRNAGRWGRGPGHRRDELLEAGQGCVRGARQHTGSADKITNCRIGVFAAYVSRHGHALHSTCQKNGRTNPLRLKAAHVPAMWVLRRSPGSRVERSLARSPQNHFDRLLQGDITKFRYLAAWMSL